MTAIDGEEELVLTEVYDEEDPAQICVNVPQTLKDAYDATHEHGELSNHVREKIERETFGEELSRQMQLERLRDEFQARLEREKDRRDEAESKIKAIKTRIAQVKDELDQLEDRQSAYEEYLIELERVIRGGGRVFPGHGKVAKAAGVGGHDPEDVIQELKERNPDIPGRAFVEKRRDPTPWNGVNSDN